MIAWSGRSVALGVRMLMSGRVLFQATGVVTHFAWLNALSLPYRSVSVTT